MPPPATYRRKEAINRLFYIAKLIFFLPLITVLACLAFLIDVCAKRLEFGSSPYTAEAWKASRILVRITIWFIGRETFDKLVIERSLAMGHVFGIKPDEVVRYHLKETLDLPEEERPVFLIKPLNVEEHAAIQDELFESKGFGKKRQEKFNIGKQGWFALRKGLKGFENFKYPDGTPIEWETPQGNTQEKNRIMDRNLNKIHPKHRAELADEIRGESTLGEDE